MIDTATQFRRLVIGRQEGVVSAALRSRQLVSAKTRAHLADSD